jgi:heterodisulfide reductase subunit A-like polyferredoxin
MHNRVRQGNWPLKLFLTNTLGRRASCFFLYFSLCFLVSCATSRSIHQSQLQRQAIVDYKIVRVIADAPEWAEDFYLEKAKDSAANALISMKKEPQHNRLLFIVDSGARADEKVACTMVRAQGRELMAEAIANFFHKQIVGKPYDVVVLGKGLKAIYEILGLSLDEESIVEEYVEARLFPSDSVYKGQKVFHCALKVAINYGDLEKMRALIIGLIRKDFYYRPNLENELKALKLP